MSAIGGAALSAALNKYGAIATGVAIGTAAKYGLTLSEGRRLTWRGVIADMLLLGMLGLLAIVASDMFGLTGNARVLVGALCAVSSDRLVRMARKRFEAVATQKVDQFARAAEAVDVIKIPPGTGSPDAIHAGVVTADDPVSLAGRNLRKSYRGTANTRPPADQIELLRRLDEEN